MRQKTPLPQKFLHPGRRSLGRGRRAWTLVLFTSAALSFSVGYAAASHWGANGWYDRHYNYPTRPSGYSQVVSVFGQPCNANASYWKNYYWLAHDNGVNYRVVHHKKLSGRGVPGWSKDYGVGSTNLYHDVRGHIGNAHWDQYVQSGIWGYSCRRKRNSNKWSTHAWGIAVDQNARYEHAGTCHTGHQNHTIYGGVWSTFQNHGWKWGKSFCDSMHFQYAINY